MMKATLTLNLDGKENITLHKVLAILKELKIDENQCDNDGRHWLQISGSLNEEKLRAILLELRGRDW